MDKKIMVTRSAMPEFEEYTQMIRPLWESRHLTNMGKLHNALEERLKAYLEVRDISLMVNGHMALEMALAAMNFPKGAEVITSPFTFISTTHAIVRSGLQPVFCDIKFSDYTIDEEMIESLITEKTVAILPIHVYGNVCAIEKINQIAERHQLKVLYDAAHAFGVRYKGKGIGNFGDASVFSFHATKIFHTIEGGCVCFRDTKWNRVLYNLKNFGIQSEEIIESIGANAKLNEFCSAMGLCNLKGIDQEIEKRQCVVKAYQEFLKGIPGIKTIEESPEIQRNYAYYPVFIDENIFGKTRDEIYNKFLENGIHARKYFYPITADALCFGNCYKNVLLENARYISERILTLPLYGELELENIERIAEIMIK